MSMISRLLPAIILLVALIPGEGIAAKPWCGDGSCKGSETADSCPSDCDATAQICGNGMCESSESCSSCAEDCGECPVTTCDNNGVCNLGEDCLSCPGDCNGVVSGKKSGRYCCGGPSVEELYCDESQCGSDCGTPSGTAAECGNNTVEFPEECDDGNTDNFDGCSAICMLETPVCGNSVIESGEQCDDGNTAPGDGCDSSCQLEVMSTQVPDNQFNVGDSIGEAEAADGTIGSINHQTVWSTGFDAADIVNSLNERFEASDDLAYQENTDVMDGVFNHAVSGAVMADFATQAQHIVTATTNTTSGSAGQITFLLGNNDVCADDLASMTDISQFEAQFRAGLDVLTGNDDTRLATIHISSLPAIYWLWESRADTSPLSWCRLFAWPNVPCQNLLASSGDDCASMTSREDPDMIYPGDGTRCQRRKQFHARIRDEYNAVLLNVVSEYANRQALPMPNLEYINIFDVRFDAVHVNGGDCFHPSEEGHALLSREQYCRSRWGEGDSACTE